MIFRCSIGRICSEREAFTMKISLNPDEKVVKMIKDGLEKKGGYCPCRLEMIEDNKCMCKEFRDQIADPEYEGFCHCMLYYKSLKD
ncbi:ferredoxin-thioredoxin reductase catalytic domain-containing protein [Anaerovibrio slackiae]|uniref:ferredoxin-thioredoxin reductase catalytic domain-containing protein n=1 Tax=Anaerovibrio slackiae TaxID=2652309 RepID=UPI00386F4F67